MSRKRLFKKRERNGIRATTYILLMIIIVCAYLSCQYFYAWSWLTETVATIIAIISAIAFWLEYRENKLLNEAQFITDLNEQFIGNDKMSGVEWELEKFYNKHKDSKLKDEDFAELRSKYDIESKERQNLVNYLVHLEGIAALVKNKVLHIETIDDLMSYRYFIAMNNPVVQELELRQYPDFYKGCFGIYEDWVKELEDQEIEIPMLKDFRLPKLEEVKQCLQRRN